MFTENIGTSVEADADTGTDAKPPNIIGSYSVLYHCVEGDSCVDENEADIVSIGVGSVADEYVVAYTLDPFEGTGTLAERALTTTGRSDDYTETSVYVFGESFESFTFTSEYEYDETGLGGSCAGTGSRIGPAPELPPFGPCPTP